MRVLLSVVALGLVAAGFSDSADANQHRRSQVAARQGGGTSLARLMSVYIERDSARWAFNRYDYGSMRNVRVIAGSVGSGNYAVRGDYTFNGGKPGWMVARFARGTLDCLEFWDTYGGCRTPNWIERPQPNYAGPERGPNGCVLSDPDPRC